MFLAVTARLFVFPAEGIPSHVDAALILAGPGYADRIAVGAQLAEQRRAAAFLISRGTPHSQPGSCPRYPGGVRVICFNPSPATTQGEAQFAGRLARQQRWKSVAIVTIAPQDTRARLRMRRCYPGSVYVLTTPPATADWPYEIAYEWGATLKALLLQRRC